MGVTKSMSVLDRIESRTVQQGDCTVWVGKVDRHGYGRIRPNVTGTDLVHRAAWIERHGPIPGRLVVMHLCDNPPCVADNHLVLGTNAANLADMKLKKRSTAKSVCHLGHAKERGKKCKPCDVIRHRRCRERKLAS